MNVAHEIVSLGRLAGEIQYPLAALRKAATELGMTATLTINGIDHFSVEDAERIAERVRAIRTSN